jgi:hypothetical protein
MSLYNPSNYRTYTADEIREAFKAGGNRYRMPRRMESSHRSFR